LSRRRGWSSWREEGIEITDDNDQRQVPLNAGSRGMARDPAEIFERQESRTCKGCGFESHVAIAYGTIVICALGKTHGKRCAKYVER